MEPATAGTAASTRLLHGASPQQWQFLQYGSPSQTLEGNGMTCPRFQQEHPTVGPHRIRVELPFEQEVNPFIERMFEHRTFFTRLHHFVLARTWRPASRPSITDRGATEPPVSGRSARTWRRRPPLRAPRRQINTSQG